MKNPTKLSTTFLWVNFELNPLTGVLYWRSTPSRNTTSGDRAGIQNIRLPGDESTSTHRAVFQWVHGTEAPEMVDHINGDHTDNRPWNLRAANRSQNMGNRITTAASGLKGVYANGTGFMAKCAKKYLGTFETKEEAHAAYCQAAQAHFGDYFYPGDAR